MSSILDRAIKIHNNKYSYKEDNLENLNTRSYLQIICPKHGEFRQSVINHLRGCGCTSCGIDSRKNRLEEFIEKAEKVHKNKYDYSKVNYINSETKVCIICPIHGEFYQLPGSHINGCGCSLCSKNKRITKDEFIRRANIVHNNYYDYSNIEYKNTTTKIKIICPIHGEFSQLPANHLNGNGCHTCKKLIGHNKLRKSNEEFINQLKEIYGDSFDYSKVNYTSSNIKVTLGCHKHGWFDQYPSQLLCKRRTSCPKCGAERGGNKQSLSTEEFIKRSKEIYRDKYDYSKTEYKGHSVPVTIICPEHGEYKTTPVNHYSRSGCPYCCSTKSKLEFSIKTILEENNIKFIPQMNFDWLRYKCPQYLDFYLPEYNIAIECQGIQHFIPIDYFGGEEGLINSKLRDSNKLKLCVQNGIELLYFSDNKYEDNIIVEVEELLSIIKSKKKLI